jgi:DNA-binding transcriptional LysR family regulator
MPEREPVPSFRRLRAFDATARLKSISAAAQHLGLSQPALTHSVAQLEAELGARLFERGPEGAFLNEAGRIFRKRCTRFFEQVGSALAQANGRGADAGVVDLKIAKLASAQVRSLLAIWRAGSFRAAARDLGLANPSLQRPARTLEQIVGAPLYRRSAAGLTVNAAGAEFARRMALAIGEIRSGAVEIGAACQGGPSVRIGVLALAPRDLLARAADRVLATGGAHRIELVEGPYAQIARDLNNGSLDLLFGALRSPPPFPDLVEEPFFEDPYTIVCRRGHPLTRLDLATPADLAPFEWVHPTIGLPRRAVLDQLTAEWGLPQSVRFETSCLATITSLLTASDRISILSWWHTEHDDRLARVNHSPISHEPRQIGLTLRANWLPTPFQLKLLECLREEALAAAADRDFRREHRSKGAHPGLSPLRRRRPPAGEDLQSGRA